MLPSVLEAEYTRKKKSLTGLFPLALSVWCHNIVLPQASTLQYSLTRHISYILFPSERRLCWLTRSSVTYGVVARFLPVSCCTLWACVAVLHPPSCLANTVADCSTKIG